jgi:transposase
MPCLIPPLSAPSGTARAQKGDPASEAIGRSKGGPSTKIHATCDALGHPTGFYLTPGQAHDLEGADTLLPGIAADTVIADKAYDADERVLEPLRQAGKTAVIPPKSNRKTQRFYDKDLYKARHRIENFLPSSNNTAPLPPATINAPEPFSLRSIWPLP